MARDFVAANDANGEYLEIDVPVITIRPATFSCWFHTPNTTTEHALMYLGDGSDPSRKWYISVRDDATIRMSVQGNASTVHVIATTNYSANTWHHACSVMRTDGTDVFLDGGGKATGTTTIGPAAGTDRFTIGRLADSTPSFEFTGRIAYAAVWGVSLTDGEVLDLALGFLPTDIRRSSLRGYWPLQRFPGFAPDLSGYRNHLTDFNTVGTAPPPPRMRRLVVHRPLVKVVAVGGANPHGPLGHPLHGPLAGPIAA